MSVTVCLCIGLWAGLCVVCVIMLRYQFTLNWVLMQTQLQIWHNVREHHHESRNFHFCLSSCRCCCCYCSSLMPALAMAQSGARGCGRGSDNCGKFLNQSFLFQFHAWKLLERLSPVYWPAAAAATLASCCRSVVCACVCVCLEIEVFNSFGWLADCWLPFEVGQARLLF